MEWQFTPGGLSWAAGGGAFTLGILSLILFGTADEETRSSEARTDAEQREWRFYSVAAAMFFTLATGFALFALFGSPSSDGGAYTLARAFDLKGVELFGLGLLGSLGLLTLPVFVTEFTLLYALNGAAGFTVKYEQSFLARHPEFSRSRSRWFRIYLLDSIFARHLIHHLRLVRNAPPSLRSLLRAQCSQDILVMLGLWSVLLVVLVACLGDGRLLRNVFAFTFGIQFLVSSFFVLIYGNAPQNDKPDSSLGTGWPIKLVGSVLFLVLWAWFVVLDFSTARNGSVWRDVWYWVAIWFKGLTPLLLSATMLLMATNFLRSWKTRLETRRQRFEEHHWDMLKQAGSSDMGTRLLHAVGNNLVAVQSSFYVFTKLAEKWAATPEPPTEKELSILNDQINVAKSEVGRLLNQVSELKRGMRFQDVAQFELIDDLVKAILRGREDHVAWLNSMDMHSTGRPWKVKIGRDSLEAILGNLIENARYAFEFARTGQSALDDAGHWQVGIRLQASPKAANDVWLVVSDNGPGIDRETIATMFQPFVSTKADGSGMGLYIVQERVRSMGGDIEAYSTKSGRDPLVTELTGLPWGEAIGAQFIISLPSRLWAQ